MTWIARATSFARRCPPGWKLTRAASEEASDPQIARHLLGCPRCAAEIESLRELVARAQGLSRPSEMSSESRRAISGRLLAGARPPARPFRLGPAVLLGGATIGVVLAAVVVLNASRVSRPVVLPSPSMAQPSASVVAPSASAVPPSASVVPPSPFVAAPAPSKSSAETAIRSRASIRAIGAARFVRISGPPDDVVRLDEGAIVLEVAPLSRGERFRVLTRDAEVEVRGTRFQVSAAGGELLAVSVSHGRVEVRSPGGGHAVLEAGDEWVRGAPGAAEPAASPKPPVAVEPSAARAAPAARASFDRAWALLRQGDPRQAATLFAEVEVLAQGRGIAEDALYWRAVAIARTGDGQEARRLFGDFLGRFPGSPRAGEAATALGWLLLDGGDRGAARTAFERATGDPSPTVRASALDGLRRATER
jgi:hypothetical protein